MRLEPGFYCPNSGTGEERPTENLPIMCPKGKYCPVDADFLPSLDSDGDQNSWEAHIGSDTPLNCQPGTYNPTPYA